MYQELVAWPGVAADVEQWRNSCFDVFRHVYVTAKIWGTPNNRFGHYKTGRSGFLQAMRRLPADDVQAVPGRFRYDELGQGRLERAIGVLSVYIDRERRFPGATRRRITHQKVRVGQSVVTLDVGSEGATQDTSTR